MKCYLCMLTQMERGIRESHTGQPRLLRATCSISVFKTANAVICRWQRLSGQHCPPFQDNWVALQRATPLAWCIPSSPMDSCKSSLFKCTLTWSTSTKGNRPPPGLRGLGLLKTSLTRKEWGEECTEYLGLLCFHWQHPSAIQQWAHIFSSFPFNAWYL